MSRGRTRETQATTQNTATNNTQTLNPWSQDQWQNQFNNVQGMFGTAPRPQIAGLSDREREARSRYQGNMGSFNPAFDQAGTDIQGAGYYRDFGNQSADYMNPYTQNVTDVAVADINRNRDTMNTQTRARQLQNRAYGGSRSAVAEGLNNEAAMREVARTSADLNYRGYNDAREYYGRDQQDRQQRGITLAGLAERRHGLNTQDIMGLNGLGEVDRGITQDQNGVDYEDFYRRLGIQQGLLGSIPMLTNSSGTGALSGNTNSTQTSNPGLLGTLGQVGRLGSMFLPGR